MVKSKNSLERIRIYIDDLLHISIPRTEDIKIQSWYEGKERFSIEIYCSKHLDIYTYDKEYIWKDVLKELDKAL